MAEKNMLIEAFPSVSTDELSQNPGRPSSGDYERCWFGEPSMN